MFEIDNKIRIIKNQEITEERKNEIYDELNLYYANNSEYYERELNKRIPEDFNFDLAQNSVKELNSDLENLKKDLEEFENRNLGNNNINNRDEATQENVEIRQREELKQQMIKNYDKAIKELDVMQIENRENLQKVDLLYTKVLEDERIQKELGI